MAKNLPDNPSTYASLAFIRGKRENSRNFRLRVERAGRRPVYNGEPLCAQEAELGGRQVKGLRTCPSALEAERDGARLKGVLDRGPRGAGTQGSAGSRCPAQTSRDPVAAFRRGVPSHQQPHPADLSSCTRMVYRENC